MAKKKSARSPEEFADTVLREFDRILKEEGDKFQDSFIIDDNQFILRGDQYGYALVLMGIDHRISNGPYVMIRASKPEAWHGKSQELKAARRLLGVKAFRILYPGSIEEKPVLSFCRTHAKRLREFNLRGTEDVGITSSTVRFRWQGKDLAALRPRLVTYARLISEMSDTSGTPEPDPLMCAREWRLQRLPKSHVAKPRAAHRRGGPFAYSVGCPECEEATSLIAQLDFSDEVLPKTIMGRKKLPIFSCLACLDWGPAFYDLSREPIKLLDAQGRYLKRRKPVTNDEVLDAQPPCQGGRKRGVSVKSAERLAGFKVRELQTARNAGRR